MARRHRGQGWNKEFPRWSRHFEGKPTQADQRMATEQANNTNVWKRIDSTEFASPEESSSFVVAQSGSPDPDLRAVLCEW